MKRIYKLSNLKISIIISLFLLDSLLLILILFSNNNADGVSISNVEVLRQDFEKDYIIKDFYKSLNYVPDKDLLSFTIPKNIPVGYKFYLHIAGALYMGDKDSMMSFHAFDEQSINYTWEKGKTYTYHLNSEGLAFCFVSFGLLDDNNKGITYDINISPDGTKKIIGKTSQ